MERSNQVFVVSSLEIDAFVEKSPECYGPLLKLYGYDYEQECLVDIAKVMYPLFAPLLVDGDFGIMPAADKPSFKAILEFHRNKDCREIVSVGDKEFLEVLVKGPSAQFYVYRRIV